MKHFTFYIFLAACSIILLHGSGTSLYGQVIDLESNLILSLPFDGNASDQSGKGVPTLVNGPILTEDRFGNPNSAYLFDGINDSINLNNNSPILTTKVFSMCFWAKMSGESLAERRGNFLFEQRDDKSEIVNARSTIGFNIDYNKEIVYSLRTDILDGTSSFVLKAPSPAYHEWHFYVCTLDDQGSAKIYVDAVLVNTGTFTQAGNFYTSVDHVNIGTHHYRGLVKAAFNGVIDDIYIYNRVINQCEIDALYSGEEFIER